MILTPALQGCSLSCKMSDPMKSYVAWAQNDDATRYLGSPQCSWCGGFNLLSPKGVYLCTCCDRHEQVCTHMNKERR